MSLSACVTLLTNSTVMLQRTGRSTPHPSGQSREAHLSARKFGPLYTRNLGGSACRRLNQATHPFPGFNLGRWHRARGEAEKTIRRTAQCFPQNDLR
jgi:hypothetical protein